MPAVSWAGPAIGAGSQAAATAASIISQAIAAGAQRDFLSGQNAMDRATRESLARMQLKESRLEADNSAKANAYKMLLAALSNQMTNADASFSDKRNANAGMDSLLASAMLRRR